MKKILSMMLCMILLLGMVTSGFAVEELPGLPEPETAEGTDDLLISGWCPDKTIDLSIVGCGHVYLVEIDEEPVVPREMFDGQSYDFEQHTCIRLEVEPCECSEFTGIDGNAANHATYGDDWIELDLIGQKNLTVIFSPIFYELDFWTEGDGGGYIEATVSAGSVTCGTVVDLTATPDECSEFMYWDGDFGENSATDPSISVVMNQDRYISASFSPKDTPILTIELIGNGQGYTNPASPVVTLCGEPTWVEAIASPCSTFVQWEDLEGTPISSEPSHAFMIDEDTTVRTRFDLIQYPVSWETDGEGFGYIKSNWPAGTYDCGTLIELEAIASPCSIFMGWKGLPDEYISTDGIVSFELTSTTAVTAYFGLMTDATLIVGMTGDGTGEISTTGATVTCGTVVEVTATPSACSTFTGWTGDLDGVDDPTLPTISLVMDQNRTINANFEPTWYELTIKTTGDGSTDPATATTALCGTTVGVVASPDPGESFINWTGDTSGADIDGELISVLMDADKTITANFTKPTPTPSSGGGGGIFIQHTLSISIEGSGSVEPFVGSRSYNPGSVVDLAAEAEPGWTFVGWLGPDGGDVSNDQITMNDDKTLIARFETTIPPEPTPLEPPEVVIPLVETPLGGGELPDTSQAIPWLNLAAGFALVGIGSWRKRRGK